MCKQHCITVLTLDAVQPLKAFIKSWPKSTKKCLQTVLNGQAFHIYHVIRCHWLCVASMDLSFATKMAEFPLLFVFWARTFLPGLGGLRKPCFPLKRGPVSLQCIGASAPLLSPQAEPAELQTSWLCALGCVIFCSGVMSPRLTITAHSVLLFSPEPLNGSLAFNKTCIARSEVHLNPLLSARFPTLSVLSPDAFLDDFAVCFGFEIH